MIIIDCQQGSPEWIEARLGIPTASQFHRLITPKTRKPSGQVKGYMLELLAEKLTGEPASTFSTSLMERGSEGEASAVSYYEFTRGVETTKVGFILHDDKLAGCSPDRLIGEDGGLEVKYPASKKHVENMLDLDPDYVMQAQGGLWVTGREWWDIMSFHPDMPPALYRVTPDAGLIEALGAAALKLHDMLVDARATLHERYGLDTSPAAVEPQGPQEPPQDFPEPPTPDEALAMLPTGDGIPF